VFACKILFLRVLRAFFQLTFIKSIWLIGNHLVVIIDSDLGLCYLDRIVLWWLWHRVSCECWRMGDCYRCFRMSAL